MIKEFNLSDYKVLPREFYSENALVVAKKLLGQYIVRKLDREVLVGRIVETEAYMPGDPASHAYIGKTNRNAVQFEQTGFTYVHSIHRYHCLDFTSDQIGVPGSVLIRALEPISGINLMKKNRNSNEIKSLMSGPGKICQAMGITREHNYIDITSKDSEIFVVGIPKQVIDPKEIIESTRIGISKAADMPYRFYIKESPFISKR